MNEGQRKRIAIEMEGAVAFPPVFEVDDGSIEVLVPVSYGRRDADGPARGFVRDLELELVRIDANGRVLSRRTTIYHTS